MTSFNRELEKLLWFEVEDFDDGSLQIYKDVPDNFSGNNDEQWINRKALGELAWSKVLEFKPYYDKKSKQMAFDSSINNDLGLLKVFYIFAIFGIGIKECNKRLKGLSKK